MEKYRTFWRRVGAALLDSLVLLPVSWVISFATIAFRSNPAAIAVSSALIGIISVFYYILMHNFYGQTFGKMAAKVKVLDDSETPINFGQAVLRSLPQLIPAMFSVSFSTAAARTDNSTFSVGTLIFGAFGLFYFADIIVCLSNEKNRALHDFIAGTVVVRTDV